jgi:hypothetical protein
MSAPLCQYINARPIFPIFSLAPVAQSASFSGLRNNLDFEYDLTAIGIDLPLHVPAFE